MDSCGDSREVFDLSVKNMYCILEKAREDAAPLAFELFLPLWLCYVPGTCLRSARQERQPITFALCVLTVFLRLREPQEYFVDTVFFHILYPQEDILWRRNGFPCLRQMIQKPNHISADGIIIF